MQVRVVTAALLACAFAIAATAPAGAYYGPKRNGDQCWKDNGPQGIGHWENCPADKSAPAQTSSTSGHTHSKHR
jgi:hypothetical protein